LPANRTPRSSRHTASSFIASKPRSNRDRISPVGAVLARDADASVLPTHRVIVHREQARSYRQPSTPLERGLPANRTPRSSRHTASSFFAGKPRSNRDRISPVGAVLARDADASVLPTHRIIVHREQARSSRQPSTRWSEACPRIQTPRSFRHTAQTFIASKVARHPVAAIGVVPTP
jgi:alkylated DNA nucleotide flippase Atl1